MKPFHKRRYRKLLALSLLIAILVTIHGMPKNILQKLSIFNWREAG
jgi:hypothetical protein